MNLYRSFGNLMESWVAEGNIYSDSELPPNCDEDSPTPSSEMATNARSESVDSGVETASSETSFPAMSCFASADNTETETFITEREGDRLTPASISPAVLSSPEPSSSSSFTPCLCPGSPEEGLSRRVEVEQVLQRTLNSKHQKKNPEPITAEDVLRRQSQASFVPKRHASAIIRGQRSENFAPRKRADTLVTHRQLSEIHRRPTSLICDKRSTEELVEEEGRRELSPGLQYLEQVCKMLEEIAQQQMHNQTLQMEMDALRGNHNMQDPDTCQSDSKAAGVESSSCQRLRIIENATDVSSEPQKRKNAHYGHFRQRSSSDTTLATLHLRKLNSDCRGQHLSINDLLERVEEENEKEEPKKKDSFKNKSWKLKLGSLKRDTAPRQQMPSSERNSARRRLSQLFRRRRKTMPIKMDNSLLS